MRPSGTLRDNLPHFLLGFTENRRPSLLALSENVRTIRRMNSQTSSAAHNQALIGLAAALKRKPTVARYTLYFSCLQVVCFDNESGPYGEARR